MTFAKPTMKSSIFDGDRGPWKAFILRLEYPIDDRRSYVLSTDVHGGNSLYQCEMKPRNAYVICPATQTWFWGIYLGKGNKRVSLAVTVSLPICIRPIYPKFRKYRTMENDFPSPPLGQPLSTIRRKDSTAVKSS